MTEIVLRVRDLQTHFLLSDVTVRAVNGLSFELGLGETLAIVGESGCGKSVAALSLMRLVPEPPGRIVGGSVELEGEELLTLPEKHLASIRGKRISMVFQDPMTSLNPVVTVGRQIEESVTAHLNVGRREAGAQALEALRLVRLPDPKRAFSSYPHQMSGGMRQRAMIAMALVCQPRVLIADEPTTALDVTIQAQILDLLMELQRELGMSILMISHDLGVVAEVADRVIVMYAGKKVEEGSVSAVLTNPLHPYTQGLLRSSISMHGAGAARGTLAEIPGMVPPPHDYPPGCAFEPRCPYSTQRCSIAAPTNEPVGDDRWVSCFEVDTLASGTQ
jgi:peptide/nickel transport system ATP-binding protein